MPRLVLILAVLMFQHIAFAQGEKKIEPPKRIEYDGLILKYNPSWKDREIYMEENLDKDPEKEIIIGFMAGHKEIKENEEVEDSKELILKPLAEKDDISIIQNYSFYQIYDKRPSGYYEPVKTINGMDRLGSIKVLRIEKEEPPMIFVLSPGGENYLDLSIYQWKEGGYTLIFNKGTSGKIDCDPDALPPSFKIEDNKGLEIFTWNNQKKVWQTTEH